MSANMLLLQKFPGLNQCSVIIKYLLIRLLTSESAILIYRQHSLDHCVWLKQEDQSSYNVELVNLCRDLRGGLVTSVVAGKAIFVNSKTVLSEENKHVPVDGSDLNTMEVKSRDLQCSALMISCNTGQIK